MSACVTVSVYVLAYGGQWRIPDFLLHQSLETVFLTDPVSPRYPCLHSLQDLLLNDHLAAFVWVLGIWTTDCVANTPISPAG